MRVLLAILLAVAAPAMKHSDSGTKAAHASLITAAQLGKGWTGKSSPQSGATLGCTGFRPSGKGIVETGAAASATLTYDTVGPFVFQKTSVYASTAQAKTYWKRSVRPGLLECAVQVLQQVSTRGVKVTITSKRQMPFRSTFARSAAYRVVGTLQTAKNTLTNYFDVILLSEGRTITVVTISSFKSAPPASFEQIVAHIIAGNLGATGGPVA